VNTRTRLETVSKLKHWLMAEIWEKEQTQEGYEFAQRITRTDKLRDMVMLVFIWCDVKDIDPIGVLERFGIQRKMEGKNGDIVEEALRMLGRSFQLRYRK